MTDDRKRVLTLGGGFGGLHLALALEKSLARDDDVNVTLVNDQNYFQYTPMLPEVVGSDIELSHVVVATRHVILPELDARLGTYAQSKMAEAGVEIRLKTRIELKSHGIKVQTINPGAYYTGYNETMADAPFRWLDDSKCASTGSTDSRGAGTAVD